MYILHLVFWKLHGATMKRFVLIYDGRKEDAVLCAKDFANNLGDQVVLIKDGPELVSFGNSKVDAVITFGGDGFILHVANELARLNLHIPIIRVNFGRVGFLANVKRNELEKRINQFNDNRYIISKRVRIMAIINGTEITALNDIVIERHSPRLANYFIKTDELSLEIRGDGAIVSTRTGSTAYNRSAGGPILLSEDKLIITKICPTDLGDSPYYELSNEAVIRVDHIQDDNVRLVADGREVIILSSNDEVEIKKCSQYTLFIEFGD